MTPTVETINLLQSLSGEWLKLPLAVMQDVGPAVQTLAGVLKITNRETFSPVGKIARKARLPAPTVRKHLVILDAGGWINNRGREHTRRGAPRRTATIAITKRTTDAIEPYGFLPWWACCRIGKVGRLPWCARAVLSVWMARLCSLKTVVQQQCEDIDFDDDGADDIECEPDDPNFDAAAEAAARAAGERIEEQVQDYLGEELRERFRFSLDYLAEQTGLTRHSIVTAKRTLNHRFGIVRWIGDRPKAGSATPTDYLVPNWAFRVVVTPASDGGVFLDFDKGCKSGR